MYSLQFHIVSSKSRELLNRLAKVIAPRNSSSRHESPIFNCPQENDDVGAFPSAIAESSGELEEILHELYRQIDAAEQLEGLFDEISVQNTFLKQQLASREENREKETAQYTRQIKQLQSINAEKEERISELEKQLSNNNRVKEKFADVSHIDKLQGDNISFLDSADLQVAHITATSFIDEAERKKLETQVQTLRDSLTDKHRLILTLKEELQSKEQTIVKLEEIIEKAEWVVDEKSRIENKTCTTFQSRLQNAKTEIDRQRKGKMEIERELADRDVQLQQLQSEIDQLECSNEEQQVSVLIY